MRETNEKGNILKTFIQVSNEEIATIEGRIDIRKMILEGNIDGALDRFKDINPNAEVNLLIKNRMILNQYFA